MHLKNLEKPFITIGHRGAAGVVLENTMESLEKAVSLGADMIEIDVHKTRTGDIIVFHDDNLERLAGIDKKVADCDWGFLKDIKLQGTYSIPLLVEVIRKMQFRCALNIELKGAGTAEPVARMLQRFSHYEMLDYNSNLISSFRHDELVIMRKIIPTIPIGVLPVGNMRDTMAFAQKVQATSIHPAYKSLKERHVRKMQEAGYKVYPWTVNKDKDKARMREMGVDGVITDYV